MHKAALMEKKKKHDMYTFQRGLLVEDQVLNDICVNMHLIHLFQEPVGQ